MSTDKLVAALSSMAGLNPEKTTVEEPSEGWRVFLDPDHDGDEEEDDVMLPTADAWLSLMWLVWVTRSRDDVNLELSAFPPLINPAPDVWSIAGTVDPVEFAAEVDRLILIPLDHPDDWEENA